MQGHPWMAEVPYLWHSSDPEEAQSDTEENQVLSLSAQIVAGPLESPRLSGNLDCH